MQRIHLRAGVAFCLGLLSFFLPVVASLPAIKVGHSAYRDSKERGHQFAWLMSVVGLAMGWISLGLFLLFDGAFVVIASWELTRDIFLRFSPDGQTNQTSRLWSVFLPALFLVALAGVIWVSIYFYLRCVRKSSLKNCTPESSQGSTPHS